MYIREIATCGSAVGNPVNHVNLVDEFCTYGASGKPGPSGRQARAIGRIYKIVKMGFRKIATCGSAVGNPVDHVNLVDEFCTYGSSGKPVPSDRQVCQSCCRRSKPCGKERNSDETRRRARRERRAKVITKTIECAAVRKSKT